jgi:hypothetical protein
MIPPPGYVPPMPHFSRNPNPSEIIQGKQVLAPFIDKNVRKLFNNSKEALILLRFCCLIQYISYPVIVMSSPIFIHI